MEIVVSTLALMGKSAEEAISLAQKNLWALEFSSGMPYREDMETIFLNAPIKKYAHNYFPAHTATPGAYALVGMGALFAGIVRVPMTSVLMIFEMTQDYAIIVPLMIANLTSLFISIRFQPQPIYEALAKQDGIHLPSAETRERHGRFRVSQAMRVGAAAFPATMSAAAALEKMQQNGCRSWPVADEGGILGMVGISALAAACVEAPATRTVAELVEGTGLLHVHRDQPLEFALERMGAAGIDALPVVARADVRKLLGIVVLRDILSVYGVTSVEKISGA